MTTTKTITHKRENSYGIRISKKQCNDLANHITEYYGLHVMFYGRYQYNATSKSYVRIFDRGELHVFETQHDAYWFLSGIFNELFEAEHGEAC